MKIEDIKQYDGMPVNQLLADLSEEFYGKKVDNILIEKMEYILNDALNSLNITGIYVKVENLNDTQFIITPIIGNKFTKFSSESTEKIEDWWT